MTSVLVRRGEKGDTKGDTEGGRGRSCADGGRDGRDAAPGQGAPRSTGSWKRQQRIFPWSLQKEHGPADTVILDFWPPEL